MRPLSLTSITLSWSLSTLDSCILHSSACGKWVKYNVLQGNLVIMVSEHTKSNVIGSLPGFVLYDQKTSPPPPPATTTLMANLETGYADGDNLWSLQQHGYVPKGLSTCRCDGGTEDVFAWVWKRWRRCGAGGRANEFREN